MALPAGPELLVAAGELNKFDQIMNSEVYRPMFLEALLLGVSGFLIAGVVAAVIVWRGAPLEEFVSPRAIVAVGCLTMTGRGCCAICRQLVNEAMKDSQDTRSRFIVDESNPEVVLGIKPSAEPTSPQPQTPVAEVRGA
jgi:hypothetical protein